MVRKNPHIGPSFDSWLDEEGIREEVTDAAIKAVIARQLASEMKKKKITRQRMAHLMKTSRAQVDRLLDPDNGSATIENLSAPPGSWDAAAAVGVGLSAPTTASPNFSSLRAFGAASPSYGPRPVVFEKPRL